MLVNPNLALLMFVIPLTLSQAGSFHINKGFLLQSTDVKFPGIFWIQVDSCSSQVLIVRIVKLREGLPQPSGSGGG